MMIYMVRAARAKHPMPMGDVCITVCMVLFKAELNLVNPVAYPTFYSSRAWQLQCDQGPDRWSQGS
jgi:hypothetical protein